MRTPARYFSWLFLCALAAPAHAQTAPQPAPPLPPAAQPAVGGIPGSRVLRTFDFEETKLGNFEATPMYWSKVVGRGYPAYSSGQFDHAVSRSPNTSFMLRTEGGSVAYRYAPPPDKIIPLQASTDYYILAFVRTSQLKHARADLVAWFADDQGNLILPSEVHSQAYTPADAARADGDAWQVLYIFLPGPDQTGMGPGPGKAKSLVLQMGLSQPQQLENAGGDDALGKFAIYQQDIQGAVWFDDISVLQMPRVGVTTHHAANSPSPATVFGPGEPVELDMQLSDLTQDGRGTPDKSLLARMRVTNSDGLVFAQQEWDAHPTPQQGWNQRFSHPPLPAGMYTATMEVIDRNAAAGSLIARRLTQFLCLPADPRSGPPAPQFGIGAAAFSDTATWNELPILLRQTGAGTLQLPVWRYAIPEESLSRRDPALESLLAILQKQNVRAVGAFAEVPAFLQAKITPLTGEDPNSVFTLLNSPIETWRPYMSFLLTRYANRLDWWEIGDPEEPLSGSLTSSTGPLGADRAVQLYARTYGELGKMLNRPEMIIPWNALFDFEAARYPHAVLDLRLPTVIKPGQIPAYLDSFRAPASAASRPASSQPAPKPPIFAHLEGLDPRHTAREDRIADFAQRVVYALTSQPESLFFDVQPGQPDELLLVYSTLIRALGNTTYQGELPLAIGDGGVKAFLFHKTGVLNSSTLVLWSEQAGREFPMDLPLGPAPLTNDLLGNRRPLTTSQSTHLTHITVTNTPLVIENVESQVLELTTSFAIAAPTLPAGAGSVRTEVLLRNPYAESISGTLRLTPPKGWTADPPSLPVSLPANGTLRQEVTLRYPFTENAGAKQLAGRLTLDQGNPTGISQIDVGYRVNVSSDQVDMEGFTRMDRNGDILIQQVITNTSSAPLDAQSYVLLPGFPRQQRYIVGLLPGQTTIKRFTFSLADFTGAGPGPVTPAVLAEKMAGAAATLGVRENDGRTLITKSVPLE